MEILKNLKVDEYTTPSPQTAAPETPVKEIQRLMVDGNFRHIPIISNGEPVGIISERDLKIVEKVWDGVGLLAEELMTPNPFVVSPTDDLIKVVFEMSKNKFGSAIVIDKDDNFLGIFTVTDALNALIEVLRGEVNK